MGFTKLDVGIIDSSIWSEPPATKIVWITMLAKSDRNGKVTASVLGIQRAAVVTLQECELALKTLSSPDPYSRTKDHEGRRIKEIDGGWLILNYAKYRQFSYSDSPEAIRQRKHRSKIVTKRDVSRNSRDTLPLLLSSESSSISSSERKEEVKEKEGDHIPPHLKNSFKDFKEMRAKIRKPLTAKAEKLLIKKLSDISSNAQDQVKIIEQSIMNSWQGFFPLKENFRLKQNTQQFQENDNPIPFFK